MLTLATFDAWLRVLTLQDHNTRIVVLGTVLLGIASGVVGSFTLLRKRALMGDALAHATLPGIAMAFLLATAMGVGAKSLPILLLGATITGVLGVGVILVLTAHTPLKQDTALGVVLSVFFGAGIALLSIVQQLGTGSAAGLESFIYGKTASMVPADVAIIAGVGIVSLVVCGLLFKEFKLLCFDPAFAKSTGWPVVGLDVLMMALVTGVTVAGLQAVGLILVIALLIIPAAAARFWTDRLGAMAVIAAIIGGVSALIGTIASAALPRLPSGAMIVIAAAVVFGVSMLLGFRHGVVPRMLRQRELKRNVAKQHLLRAAFEVLEGRPLGEPIALTDLQPRRSWNLGRLRASARWAERAGQVVFDNGHMRLTDRGQRDAERFVRNHRLWETYLINFADIAPSHVDRDADMIEHVLDADMIAELERLVEANDRLASPHEIAEATEVQR
ncbi:MAG: iron chelate uptake ABC transporter family permease subunit [Planctomycetota bacterium]